MPEKGSLAGSYLEIGLSGADSRRICFACLSEEVEKNIETPKRGVDLIKKLRSSQATSLLRASGLPKLARKNRAQEWGTLIRY